MIYIPMRRGFLYLVAILDWSSRNVLAWRLSNTIDADFCVAALEEAIASHGKPDIFNTDQGSQSTSFAFTATLAKVRRQGDRAARFAGRGGAALVKQYRQLSYEELAFHLEDSASFRAFARLSWGWGPKKLVLHKTISAIRADTWEVINRMLLLSARQDKLERGKIVRWTAPSPRR